MLTADYLNLLLQRDYLNFGYGQISVPSFPPEHFWLVIWSFPFNTLLFLI